MKYTHSPSFSVDIISIFLKIGNDLLPKVSIKALLDTKGCTEIYAHKKGTDQHKRLQRFYFLKIN